MMKGIKIMVTSEILPHKAWYFTATGMNSSMIAIDVKDMLCIT